MLLAFLDLAVYQAVMTSTDDKTRTYDSVKNLLLTKYSMIDEFIDRLSFFGVKYSSPPEKFAATLNELFDLFSCKGLKEELQVFRFFSREFSFKRHNSQSGSACRAANQRRCIVCRQPARSRRR